MAFEFKSFVIQSSFKIYQFLILHCNFDFDVSVLNFLCLI